MCLFFLDHKDEARVTILGLIPLHRRKFWDNIVKWFTPDAIKRMQMANYNSNSGEVSFPIDEYISTVKAGDAKLNLVHKPPQMRKQRT